MATMSKQLNDTLIKDDNSFFELINQLTEELPPREMTAVENGSLASFHLSGEVEGKWRGNEGKGSEAK